mmetsp:Transcript_21965/g.65498  ORF Transcript_21965/g.65498 Transcript_21965/m.65498 type:complete len:229 (-) Transcript_21965:365-1051(-)
MQPRACCIGRSSADGLRHRQHLPVSRQPRRARRPTGVKLAHRRDQRFVLALHDLCHQHGGHFAVVISLRELIGRDAAVPLVECVADIGLDVEQHLHDAGVALLGRFLQRAPLEPPVAGEALDVGIELQQHLADVGVALARGHGQGRPALVAPVVRVGAIPQQLLHDDDVALSGGHQKRRGAVFTQRVDVGLQGQQAPRDVRVPDVASLVQWRVTVGALRVDVPALFHQ